MKQEKKPGTRDNPEQSRRFLEKARELGSDETGKAFERAFRKIVPRKLRRDEPRK